MSLHLYDTATRSVREFVPRQADRVGIYLCGMTVQSEPHIGHLRSGVSYDVLRRWLSHHGYQVFLIRNITDIDDKVLAKSTECAWPWWGLAYANERLVGEAYAALGTLPATYEPRATGHIPDILGLIDRLVGSGHAYRSADGSGDVYFDVRSFPGYGALSGQRLEQMQPAEDSDDRGKRDPRDFALWKGHKSDEPADAQWFSAYGAGRPGWHIECSAMARRYLGDDFDIHGGGLDLVFPHHENEMAQSRAAGFGFAGYWVHNGLLNNGGEKMSKSLGNVVYLQTLFDLGLRPVEARYYLIAPHYRSLVEYSEAAVHDAALGYRRIEGFVHRSAERVGAVSPGAVTAEFAAALDDDLNTSKAIAAVHEQVRRGNAALAAEDDEAVGASLASVRTMLDVLGIDPLSPMWSASVPGADRGELRAVTDRLVGQALHRREQARQTRDWVTADAVRDELKEAGVLIEDTPHGPRWTLADGMD